MVKFRRPTPFVAESLDVPMQKPGSTAIGTAPFMVAPNSPSGTPSSEMVAHDGYYLGKPSINRIVISAYPNVRAAWADMLRDRLDMLYEVSVDALGSMEGASNVSLYTFDRPSTAPPSFDPRCPGMAHPPSVPCRSTIGPFAMPDPRSPTSPPLPPRCSRPRANA